METHVSTYMWPAPTSPDVQKLNYSPNTIQSIRTFIPNHAFRMHMRKRRLGTIFHPLPTAAAARVQTEMCQLIRVRLVRSRGPTLAR